MKGKIVDKYGNEFDVEIDEASIEVDKRGQKALIESAQVDHWLGGTFKISNAPPSISNRQTFALLIIDEDKFYFGKCGVSDPIYNKYLFGIAKLQISEQMPTKEELIAL